MLSARHADEPDVRLPLRPSPFPPLQRRRPRRRRRRLHVRHLEGGGQMLVTLAGAMSTAELGLSLAEMIRQGQRPRDQLHGRQPRRGRLQPRRARPLRAHPALPRPHARRRSEDLLARHLNRVTDTCIPEEEAMRRIERAIGEEWHAADEAGARYFPARVSLPPSPKRTSGRAPTRSTPRIAGSWPPPRKTSRCFVPGWEDSTLGNIYAAHCLRGDVRNVHTVRTGIEYMIRAGAVVPGGGSGAAPGRLFPDRRRHRGRLPDLRRPDAGAGSTDDGRPEVGLLLPDLRLDDQLRLLLRRRPQREDHLGQAHRRDADVSSLSPTRRLWRRSCLPWCWRRRLKRPW